MHQLRKTAWVPQRDDRFVHPKDAVRDLLPGGFPFDAGAAWLKAIGFEQEIAKRSDEHARKRSSRNSSVLPTTPAWSVPNGSQRSRRKNRSGSF